MKTVKELLHEADLMQAADLLYEIIFEEEALDIHKENPDDKTMYSSSARVIILLDKLGYEINKELVDEANANMEE